MNRGVSRRQPDWLETHTHAQMRAYARVQARPRVATLLVAVGGCTSSLYTSLLRAYIVPRQRASGDANKHMYHTHTCTERLIRHFSRWINEDDNTCKCGADASTHMKWRACGRYPGRQAGRHESHVISSF